MADGSRHVIRIINQNGTCHGLIGTFNDDGQENHQLYFPRTVAADNSGNVYISQVAGNRANYITKFDSSGSYVDKFYFGATPNDYGMTIRDEVLYLNFHGRIQTFNTSGSLLSTNPLPDEVTSPNGIAVDSNGYIYIGDANTHKIYKMR